MLKSVRCLKTGSWINKIFYGCFNSANKMIELFGANTLATGTTLGHLRIKNDTVIYESDFGNHLGAIPELGTDTSVLPKASIRKIRYYKNTPLMHAVFKSDFPTGHCMVKSPSALPVDVSIIGEGQTAYNSDRTAQITLSGSIIDFEVFKDQIFFLGECSTLANGTGVIGKYVNKNLMYYDYTTTVGTASVFTKLYIFNDVLYAIENRDNDLYLHKTVDGQVWEQVTGTNINSVLQKYMDDAVQNRYCDYTTFADKLILTLGAYIYSSLDGINFTQRHNAGGGKYIKRIAHSDNKLIAVGLGTHIVETTNGVNYTIVNISGRFSVAEGLTAPDILFVLFDDNEFYIGCSKATLYRTINQDLLDLELIDTDVLYTVPQGKIVKVQASENVCDVDNIPLFANQILNAGDVIIPSSTNNYDVKVLESDV